MGKLRLCPSTFFAYLKPEIETGSHGEPEILSGSTGSKLRKPQNKDQPSKQKEGRNRSEVMFEFSIFLSIIKKDDSVGFGTLSGKNRVINFSIFSKCSTDKLSQIVSLNYPQKKFEK